MHATSRRVLDTERERERAQARRVLSATLPLCAEPLGRDGMGAGSQVAAPDARNPSAFDAPCAVVLSARSSSSPTNQRGRSLALDDPYPSGCTSTTGRVQSKSRPDHRDTVRSLPSPAPQAAAPHTHSGKRRFWTGNLTKHSDRIAQRSCSALHPEPVLQGDCGVARAVSHATTLTLDTGRNLGRPCRLPLCGTTADGGI
jgi:hypothetical protein